MGKQVNVLILDDNEIIADNVKKRISKANESHSASAGFEVLPHHITIDINNLSDAAEKITAEVISKRIDVLLLDRGFYNIIDPVTNRQYGSLDSDMLYCRKGDKGHIIEEILRLIHKDTFKSVSSVIIYTYDDAESYSEPALIKQAIRDVLPPQFDKNAIDVILTYPEIYELSELKLYKDPIDVNGFPDIELIGPKSDFMLYGLFMGEILYHRTVSLIKKRQYNLFQERRAHLQIRLFLFFGIFTFLNLGANALYNLLSRGKPTDVLLLLTSLAFALILPWLILMIKPELVIDIED
jgi:hypothetical protein